MSKLGFSGDLLQLDTAQNAGGHRPISANSLIATSFSLRRGQLMWHGANMENDGKTEANRASMTIKSVDVETRLKMGAEAAKHGLTMAQYLNRVMAAGGKPLGQPMVIPPNQSAAGREPREALADAIAAAQMVATLASAGVPLTATAIRHGLAMVSSRLREARGLPPTRLRIASRANRQTTAIEHD